MPRTKAPKESAPKPPPHVLELRAPLRRKLDAVEYRVVVECDNNLQAIFGGINQTLNEEWKGSVSHATAILKNVEDLPGGRLRFTLSYLTVPQE